ncbi:hypothetical protein BC939DRAFT_435737, partial [Gamsiella multidivaricata]|uniref:uncharacterized protein n=1 Tax=Gamsiella multidivaricata TaxID=101098 RepID=UPI00221F4289
TPDNLALKARKERTLASPLNAGVKGCGMCGRRAAVWREAAAAVGAGVRSRMAWTRFWRAAIVLVCCCIASWFWTWITLTASDKVVRWFACWRWLAMELVRASITDKSSRRWFTNASGVVFGSCAWFCRAPRRFACCCCRSCWCWVNSSWADMTGLESLQCQEQTWKSGICVMEETDSGQG